jgi:hypothetical protein
MYRLVIIAFLGFLTCSCSEKIFTAGVDCEECYRVKPDSAYLRVDLTINDTYETIPLVIYRNEVEKNDTEYVDTAYESPYYLLVPVNKEYSVAAEYIKATDKIIAIDGTRIKIKHVSSECDEDCWIIEGDELNMELKY